MAASSSVSLSSLSRLLLCRFTPNHASTQQQGSVKPYPISSQISPLRAGQPWEQVVSRSITIKAAAARAPGAVGTEMMEKCVNTIRFLAVDAVEKANSGHPGLPMGCAPLGQILFDEVMRYNPKNPYWFNRDRFLLSAGHGCMLQYALLHLAGFDSVKVTTTIGYGSPNKANSYSAHGSALGSKEVDATRKKLGWPYEPFQVPDDVKKHWSRHVPDGAALEDEWNVKFAEYEKKYEEEARELRSIINGVLPTQKESNASLQPPQACNSILS